MRQWGTALSLTENIEGRFWKGHFFQEKFLKLKFMINENSYGEDA